MNIEIDYAGGKKEIEVPDQNLLAVIDPKKVEKKDEGELVRKALGTKFSDFIKNGKILFIVNDGQRPTPTAKLLYSIHDEIKDKNPHFIVATGSHREPTEEELNRIFGEENLNEFRNNIFIHKAKESPVEFIGKTSRGTEVSINKKALEFDKLININSVEPHYFAGYSGGRKSFFPGICAHETIAQNHRYALRDESQNCRLKGNPVHEDMEEAVGMLADKKEIFSINLVADGDSDIYDVQAGEWKDSFYRAVESCKEIYCVPIKEKAEVVITVAQPPMDINLYQSQKSIENGKMALKEGGILILVSECIDGIGPSEFYDLLSKSDIPEELFKEIHDNYVLGHHKAAKILSIVSCSRICAVTSLDDETIKKCFITPSKDLQNSLDSALKEKGPGAKVIILRHGSATAPLLSQP
ncbi:MAG: nickel-dependent lactate racemase [Candidatus Altiarchaeales archaeon]|nr:nickel-dependent lactate racemase [Candidatus Altiarchaeota archaeon]MBU4406838.1 nickel-dependent lactate racemase [Candidatus Altiarchaeota archaeon]MCG2782590.1 nickel-dependent lactate racemase [Candidatus Altiarchaeales archaeon]